MAELPRRKRPPGVPGPPRDGAPPSPPSAPPSSGPPAAAPSPSPSSAPPAPPESRPGSPRYGLRRTVVLVGIAIIAALISAAVIPELINDSGSSSKLASATGVPVTQAGPTSKPASNPHWSRGITCNGSCEIAADADRAYVVEGSRPESKSTKITAYQAASGRQAWSSPLSIAEVSGLRSLDAGVVISGDDMTVVLDPTDGKQRWKARGELAGAGSDGLVLTESTESAAPTSRLVDPDSGDVKWKATGSLVPCGSVFVGGSDTELVARDGSGGEQWSERVTGAVASRGFSCSDRALAYRTSDEEITVRSVADGKEMGTIETKDADLEVVVADDTVITVGGGDISAYEQDGDTYERAWKTKGPEVFADPAKENVLLGGGRLLVIVPAEAATLVDLDDGKPLGRRGLQDVAFHEVTTASLLTGNLSRVQAFDLTDLGRRWSLKARFVETIAAGGSHLFAVANDNALQAYS